MDLAGRSWSIDMLVRFPGILTWGGGIFWYIYEYVGEISRYFEKVGEISYSMDMVGSSPGILRWWGDILFYGNGGEISRYMDMVGRYPVI